MNGAHIHLMAIHFPVAGMVLALPLLLAAWWLKNGTLKVTALALVLLLGPACIVALESGEAARDIVELQEGVSPGSLHEHEEAAEKVFWVAQADALLAAVGLFLAWKKKAVPMGILAAVTVLTLLAAAGLTVTANLGGKVHHPEIRSGFTPPPGHGHHRD